MSRPGCFERAHGGSLFLDEIGTLSFTAQGALRVLQEGETAGRRSQGAQGRRAVIAATNVSPDDAVKEGSFREDLFYRLNVSPDPRRCCATGATTFRC